MKLGLKDLSNFKTGEEDGKTHDLDLKDKRVVGNIDESPFPKTNRQPCK